MIPVGRDKGHVRSTAALHDYYDHWWESGRDPRQPVFDQLNSLVERRLPVPSGGSAIALDVGSGRGAVARMLLTLGYRVECVEPNPRFAQLLRKELDVRVHEVTAQALVLDRVYELCTMVQVTQNIEPQSLALVLKQLGRKSLRLHVTLSNPASLHGWWVRFRGFRAPFVHEMRVDDFRRAMYDAGFDIAYHTGVGLLTPITLFDGFRGRILAPGLATVVNKLDGLAPSLCHLQYFEATTSRSGGAA